MGSGNRSIRFRIFLLLLLPLLSLSALWGFVLNLTIGDGLVLLKVDALYKTIGVPSTELGAHLQRERALSAVAISSRVITSELGAQRAATDASLKEFRKSATSEEAADVVPPALRPPLQVLLDELDRLPEIRRGIDERSVTRLKALTDYNRILDQLFRVYDQLVAVPDLSIYQQAAALQTMGNAREILAREDALISGALIDKRFSHDEHYAAAEYVALRRFLHAKGLSALDAELRAPYEEVLGSPLFREYMQLEQQLVTSSNMGTLPPAAESRWRVVTDDLMAKLDKLAVDGSAVLTERSTSIAIGVLIRIGVAGGIGLIAVVASIIFSVRFGRRMVRELSGLRKAATELAHIRLPGIVERLSRAEKVDVEAEAPPIQAGGSLEVADVARAFSAVQRTAIEAAVGQAKLREGVNQVFLNLARRKQSLLRRQHEILDAMQRRTADPNDLEDLYRIDHLTTRMRRHAENLIVLSGAQAGRTWRNPIPIIDVLRAAAAEVEDYTRVNVVPGTDATLIGPAVADVTHLIAELIDNAAMFSPPDTTVTVRGDMVGNGFAVEVEDRGLGLTPEEYAAINERLAHPPEFDPAESDRLGLFVVGRLAARHGINVMLRPSPFGGTTAIVLIPRSLLGERVPPLRSNTLTLPTRTSTRRERRWQRRAELQGADGAEVAGAPTRSGLHRLDGAGTPQEDARADGVTRTDGAGTDMGEVAVIRPRAADAPDSAGTAAVDGTTGDGDPAADTPAGGNAAANAPAGDGTTGDNATVDAPAGDGGPAANTPTGDTPAPTVTVLPAPVADAPVADASAARGTAAAPKDRDTSPAEDSMEVSMEVSAENRTAAPVVRDLFTPHVPVSAPADPEEPRSPSADPAGQPEASAGLPRRIRQANMAPQLRRQHAADSPRSTDRFGLSSGNETEGDGPVPRSPDEVRALFSAFQQGSRRGREEADQARNTERNTTGDKRDE
ncbi:sensor histidine kinase [Thermostaphylospora chromogena]|uniref:histidine kinase n=1 Tax=Thermostaphylospora chromogena TaxID=35622 RepID=A0A1H1D2T1_9ACTN|nr:sensor histidine kinase [Thermostaphylospora chromogena]SDQ70825.1 Signal transduction histidine kinase [Thermostaphylospora chromogena]